MSKVEWVCLDCAEEKGARIPYGHRPTWHTGICDLCGEDKIVTEPRDFGITRHLIE